MRFAMNSTHRRSVLAYSSTAFTHAARVSVAAAASEAAAAASVTTSARSLPSRSLTARCAAAAASARCSVSTMPLFSASSALTRVANVDSTSRLRACSFCRRAVAASSAASTERSSRCSASCRSRSDTSSSVTAASSRENGASAAVSSRRMASRLARTRCTRPWSTCGARRDTADPNSTDGSSTAPVVARADDDDGTPPRSCATRSL
mmetsp:Transcript_2821/g.9969  ORF Transcript_2821/g.9969 Transcript_2821/m.9969 type:complete len:207 (+) Transcript_2821:486-1106(+)